MNLGDRIRGGLYGVAVGDALGATVEFMAKEIVQQRHGVLTDIVGGGWLRLVPGEWTDDTDMTLAVAAGIIQAPHDPVNSVGEEFLRWYKTSPPDVGTTIAAVLHKVSRGHSWHEGAYQLHCETSHTAGNGALMRTLPVGLAYCEQMELMDKAQSIAQMTHWDERAVFTCQLYCLLVYYLLSEKSFTDSLASAYSYLARKCPDKEALLTMRAELEQRMAAPDPTGYSVDTLACVLWALQSADNLEEAVIAAVNLGGDADTVGAVTGGLAGVHYSFETIPERWLKKFSPCQREQLDRTAERLLAVRSQV